MARFGSLHAAFARLDRSRNGRIGALEFVDGCKAAKLRGDGKTWYRLFEIFDANRSGSITLHEFEFPGGSPLQPFVYYEPVIVEQPARTMVVEPARTFQPYASPGVPLYSPGVPSTGYPDANSFVLRSSPSSPQLQASRMPQPYLASYSPLQLSPSNSFSQLPGFGAFSPMPGMPMF